MRQVEFCGWGFCWGEDFCGGAALGRAFSPLVIH